MASPPHSPAPQKHIAILGAGITGLQTALSILSSPLPHPSSPAPKVTIVAQHLPGDESIDYTSPWAGGHWRSHAHAAPADAEIRAWDARTYAEWRRLLDPGTGGAGGPSEEREKYLGLGVRESLMFWAEQTDETAEADGAGLWWREVVGGFRVLSARDLAAASRGAGSGALEGEGGAAGEIVFGARYDTVCVNVPRYLAYLMERVTALGGEFVRAVVRTEGGMEGVVEDVQRIVRGFSHHTSGQPQLEAIVLAAGLLSQKFLPEEEADKLYPVRGQTVLVKGEGPRAVTHLFPGGEIGYVIPRPGSGTTIIGGCKEVGSWVAEEDRRMTERILGRGRALVPELLTGEKGEFEVLSVQVGRRPGRKGGPRVELEKERVKGVKVLYVYGHEGAGYQNSVGSAEKVVALLKGS